MEKNQIVIYQTEDGTGKYRLMSVWKMKLYG